MGGGACHNKRACDPGAFSNMQRVEIYLHNCLVRAIFVFAMQVKGPMLPVLCWVLVAVATEGHSPDGGEAAPSLARPQDHFLEGRSS